MRAALRLGLMAVLAFTCVSGWAEEAAWKAGTARARITPEEPLWLAGYAARTRPAEGTMHDLWVKVLALEAADGTRGVIVTADLLNFTRENAAVISAELERACGLSRAQVMLTASHTHSGPVLDSALADIYPLDDEQLERIAAYTRRLEETVIATVGEALAAMEPVSLFSGEGRSDFAVNRRANPEAEVPRRREEGSLVGPVDHRVPVLAVRGEDGAWRAVVFGYACHATTLDGYEWSGDYPGFAQLALEEKHPGVQAMFHAGCAADQNPIPRRDVELCRQYGERLAAAVDRVLAEGLRPVGTELETAWSTIRLEFGRQPSKESLEALSQREDYIGRWARRLLAEIEAGEELATGCPYPVQVWRLGDEVLWIVLGGEVVVDYALRFAEEFGPGTWITAYANDVMAYIPSRRVWEEGGYEAGAFSVYGLPAEAWEEDIESRVADAVTRLVDQVRAAEAPR